MPISARYEVGLPELIAVLIGLAQQFLSEKLVAINETGHARGIILELQEELGIGQTANIILTEGKLSVGDKIVLVKRDGAIGSKVKALFMPKPLDEMRDPRDKFTPVQEVYSAAGVKLVSTDLEGVIPGTSVITYLDETEFQSIKADEERDLSLLEYLYALEGLVLQPLLDVDEEDRYVSGRAAPHPQVGEDLVPRGIYDEEPGYLELRPRLGHQLT